MEAYQSVTRDCRRTTIDQDCVQVSIGITHYATFAVGRALHYDLLI